MSDNFAVGIILIVIFLIGGFFGSLYGGYKVIDWENGRETVKLQRECEKDLARNLKCEMVYVKPSIKEGE